MIPSGSRPSSVSAYIPCYNNAGTIGLAIAGIRNQTHPVDELLIVDDGSSDNSAAVAEGLGTRVIRMGKNQGRGAVRAQAMEAARNEFVLCCDATNQLSANFLESALKWLSCESVLAVFGRYYDRNPQNTVDRWRARHLFKQQIPLEADRRGYLSTYGAVVRKSAVLRAGNYDRLLRHGEDFDLGVRLLAMGDVIADPTMEVQPVVHNTLFQVMERFARWNRASVKNYTLSNFIENHVLAWRILIPRDLEQRDWQAALISATLPYFTVAHADHLSFTFSAKPTLEKEPPLQTKP
jgi:glycosyltransferase involved in cell wall biosynthesis